MSRRRCCPRRWTSRGWWTTNHYDAANQAQGGPGSGNVAPVPVQDGHGGGAGQLKREREVCDVDAQEGGESRPRRAPKPNSKYKPAEYDLSIIVFVTILGSRLFKLINIQATNRISEFAFTSHLVNHLKFSNKNTIFGLFW
jgi:hypothetical protein